MHVFYTIYNRYTTIITLLYYHFNRDKVLLFLFHTRSLHSNRYRPTSLNGNFATSSLYSATRVLHIILCCTDTWKIEMILQHTHAVHTNTAAIVHPRLESPTPVIRSRVCSPRRNRSSRIENTFIYIYSMFHPNGNTKYFCSVTSD